MSKIAPCKDCNKRTVACHDTCKDYIDWAAERKKISREKYLDSLHRASPAAKTKTTAKVLTAQKGVRYGTDKHSNDG